MDKTATIDQEIKDRFRIGKLEEWLIDTTAGHLIEEFENRWMVLDPKHGILGWSNTLDGAVDIAKDDARNRLHIGLGVEWK